jgi:parallel beta-helix repeat protein
MIIPPEHETMSMKPWMLVLLMSNAGVAAMPLPVPTAVHDGDTILLDCGRVYVGELDLSNRRGVTVTTRGDCGNAAITPAQPVAGWKKNPRHPGWWSARLDTAPLQFEIDGRFIALAHHPNTPGQWLHGEKSSSLRLKVQLPDHPLVGATLVWRAADWLIQSRTITAFEDGVIQLAPGDDEGFGLPAETEFYVEGRSWMLDSPGEWVHADGWLHVWPPDGKSPEGRAWATGRARAINASGSQDVSIHHLTLFAATLGIDGTNSRHLRVTDTRILNSSEAAVLIGGKGAELRRLRISGTVEHGVRANDDARDVVITDTHITGAGMLGMPRRSKGAIVFEAASGHKIQRNHITDSASIGIRVFRDAMVADNVIDRACLRLSDCGGIYTFARDRQPLNTVIERNHITRLHGRTSYAIYLDDFANGVTVRGNRLTDNPGGMQLHNGFDNLISKNIFSNSRHEHILLNETTGFASIIGNRFFGNHFSSFNGVPTFRLWSHQGGKNVRQFARFDSNTYSSAASLFAEVEGQGMLTFQDWQTRVAPDARARFSVPVSFPKLAGEREKK